VTNVSPADLNAAIVQGYKINDTDESGITVLDYAILTLKYAMIKPICVFVNLLLPSERNTMFSQYLDDH
jgi:hypothetical protein